MRILRIYMRYIDVLMLVVFIFFLNSCAKQVDDRVVQTGDSVAVNYTCRLDTGEVATTSVKAVAEDPNVVKSNIFIPWKTYPKKILTAGKTYAGPAYGYLKRFEVEVISKLQEKLPGMTVGETRTVLITSKTIENIPESERFLKYSRVRKRPKFHKVKKDVYEKKMGKIPEVGQVVFTHEGSTGIIREIDKSYVHIGIEINEDYVHETPFGKAYFRDGDETFYEIVTDARVGHLIATGPIVGRISDVDDTMFTIDYGHPFGGEQLVCEIHVESIEPGNAKQGKDAEK